MTSAELSREFDILYENISSFQAPGLDEYEKSVFLTTAQEEVLLGIYNGTNVGFESTEEARRYLSCLITTSEIYPYTSPKKEDTDNPPKEEEEEGSKEYTTISDKSTVFELPKDIWFITYESATKATKSNLGNTLEVIPTTQDEFHRIKNNPFRKANNKRALRLDLGDNLVEIVSEDKISSYTLRYLRKPRPIILEILNDDLKIEDTSNESLENFHPALYRVILKRAVALAMAK